MILFDRPTAQDLLDAFRLLEGRLRGQGRALSDGSAEILRAAELSLAVRSDQPAAGDAAGADDGPMSTMYFDVECLTLDEVAREHLHVSESTVRRYIDDGELPVVRLGRSVRVRRSTLQEFLDTHESRGARG